MVAVGGIGAVVPVSVCAAGQSVGAQTESVRGLSEHAGWTAVTSEGVQLKIGRDAVMPSALRLDYDFQRGSGYAIARLALPKGERLPFGENFRFDLRVRGETVGKNGAVKPITGNTLEFKLIDGADENVWWVNKPKFTFPARTTDPSWAELTFRRRHFSFAWGPNGGKPLDEIAYIEFVITSGAGGASKGTVWLDGVRYQALPAEQGYTGTPVFRATSRSLAAGKSESPAEWKYGRVIGAEELSLKLDLAWRSGKFAGDPARFDPTPALTIDFGAERSFGGMQIQWADDRLAEKGQEFATAERYEVQFSNDGREWTSVRVVDGSGGGVDTLQLPESTTRYVMISVTPEEAEAGKRAVGIDAVTFLPLGFGESPNMVFNEMAQRLPRGWVPAYFSNRAAYWTVTGVDGDAREALIGEYGAVEIDKSTFSLEPFVYLNTPDARGGRFITWGSVDPAWAGIESLREGSTQSGRAKGDGVRHSLSAGYLPIPSVSLDVKPLELTATAWAYPDPMDAKEVVTAVRYELVNKGKGPFSGKFFVALRPFQVNPSYQFLNTVGGFAPIHSIMRTAHGVRVNGRMVVTVTEPSGFGATNVTGGDVVEYLSRGIVPKGTAIDDREGLASGALEYAVSLAPGEKMTVLLAAPSSGAEDAIKALAARGTDGQSPVADSLKATEASWHARLDRATMTPPKGAERMWDVARAQLGYILVNRDGAAIQPGSRSYERTWIRDGSLTCNALLDFGMQREVRDFLDWFAPYQYDNGKVPCCVDARGPDPVPEHDSHGQFIYAINTYAQYTGDLDFLRRHYDRVKSAVGYMQSLRNQRLTPKYTEAPAGSVERGMAGVLPESISHEGYSAKPMHSYWDSLFNLRGLKDAATIAHLLGHEEDAATFARYADEARESLIESYRQTMLRTGIDYLPGCVELGDFDATSTTVALFPVNELGTLPEPALHNTFERYWKHFVDRRDGTLAKPWDAYTPYETRAIGAFVRLGWRERAHELIDYFLDDQRPAGWNAFSEVVFSDRNKAGFVGDIPHTWCGSDYVNSFRSLFVYEREDERKGTTELVLLHGVTREWMDAPEGFSLSNWSTAFGPVSMRVSHASDGKSVVVKIEAGSGSDLRPFAMPNGGAVVLPPDASMATELTVNGTAADVDSTGGIRIGSLPAEIRWEYAAKPTSGSEQTVK